MKYIYFNTFLLLALLTLSLHSSLIASSNYSKIPFEKSSGLLLVKAMINGVEGKLIFDTAADHLLINDSVSTGMENHSIVTLTGSTNSQKMNIESLSIGDFSAKDITAYATDLSLLETHVGEKLMGILGAGLLKGELIRIDISEGVIEILPRKMFKKTFHKNSIKFPVVFENEIPVVELQMDGHKLRFVLDTGSSVSIVDEATIQKFKSYFKKTNKQFNLLTASSQMDDAYYYNCFGLSLAGFIISDTELAVLDMTEINQQFSTPVQGVLALDDLPFQSIIVDYHNAWVYIDQL